MSAKTPINQEATPKGQPTPKQKEVEDLLKRYSELDMNDESNLKQQLAELKGRIAQIEGNMSPRSPFASSKHQEEASHT